MKKYMVGMLMAAFAFIAMLPQQTYAAENASQQAVQLQKDGDKAAIVKLKLPNAAGEELSSVQLSLKVKAKTEAEFVFDKMVSQTAKVYEAPYTASTGTMNIYVAGTQPLYAEGQDTLTLGKLVLNDAVTVKAEDVKLVRGTKVEELDLSASLQLTAANTPAAAPTTTPTAVRPAKVTKLVNASSGITVKWQKSSNAAGYYVYRKTAKGSWKKIKTIKKRTTSSYTDKTVKAKNGTKYFYTVQAYNGTRKSTYSKTGISILRLTTPTLLKPQSKTSKTMLVKWKKNAKSAGYQIQYSTNKDFTKSWTRERVNSKKKTSKTVKNLKKGKTYYVRIRSFKKVGGTVYYSAWGNPKQVKIK